MRRIIITFLWVTLLAMSWRQARGFALLGPLPSQAGLPATYGDAWQTPEIGYALGGDIGTPKNAVGGSIGIGQGYRRNIPVMYYGYNENFSSFFGLQGEEAVDNAFQILNGVFTNNASLGLDGYSSNLVEFPFNSGFINNTASSLGLTDLKSTVLYLMMEQDGLAEPERYAWGLHYRYLPPGGTCPIDEEYLVDQRNFYYTTTPVTQTIYSPYVNNTLYTYMIQEDCVAPNPIAETIPQAVDPVAETYTAVAGLGDGLGFPETSLPGTIWSAPEVGFFYTGLTADDVGGLRFLMSTNHVVFEDPGFGSFLEATNNSLTPITTQNLAALLQFAQTNNEAALLAAYPNLVIDSVSNYNIIVTNPIVYSYFTNYTGSEYGAPPVFVIGTNGWIGTFETNYSYTFGNMVIVDESTNTPAQLVTVSLAQYNGSPAGTGYYTNVTYQPITLTNFISGDYFLLPPNSCGFNIVETNYVNVFVETNSFVTATNTTSTLTGFVGSQAVVYDFTQHLYQAYACNVQTSGPAEYQGIGRIQYVRVPDQNIDTLTGTFVTPITNTYTMVMYTNNQYITQTFQRIVTQPDILFNGADMATPNPASPVIGAELGTRNVNFDVANIPAGEAGPGVLNPPTVITLDTVGDIYGNGSVAETALATNGFLSQLTQVSLLAWASFDATTNPPIVYPNGTSIQELENSLIISVTPTTLPAATNNYAYPTTFFTVTGGQGPNYTWSYSGNLPEGLNFYNGVLSGEPVDNPPGTYDFTIEVTDESNRSVYFNYSILIVY